MGRPIPITNDDADRATRARASTGDDQVFKIEQTGARRALRGEIYRRSMNSRKHVHASITVSQQSKDLDHLFFHPFHDEISHLTHASSAPSRSIDALHEDSLDTPTILLGRLNLPAFTASFTIFSTASPVNGGM